MKKKTCLCCRKKYQQRDFKKKGAKFCSLKCKENFYKKKKKKCVVCGKSFSTIGFGKEREAKAKCCSVSCKKKYLRSKIKYTEKICIRCGAHFFVKNADIHRYKKTRTFEFCSRKCKNNPRVKVLCNYCGKELIITSYDYKHKKKHYCNVECMGKGMSTSIKVICSFCGKPFFAEPGRIARYTNLFCSNLCKIKSLIKLDGYFPTFGKYRTLSKKIRESKEYRKWRLQVLDTKGKICNKCKSKKYLQVHHYKISLFQIVVNNKFKIGKIFKDPTLWDINNTEVLCVSCHRKEHIKP